jgi:hypothetical protein
MNKLIYNVKKTVRYGIFNIGMMMIMMIIIIIVIITTHSIYSKIQTATIIKNWEYYN